MSLSTLGFTGGGSKATGSANLTVSCPSDVVAPVGSLLVVGISVRSRNDGSGAHTITTPSGWTQEATRNSADTGTDYKQLWVYSRVKQAGDTSWTFRSNSQVPCRVWICVAVAGFDSADGVIEAAGDGAASGTSHSLPGVTINTANNWRLSFTSDHSDELSGGWPSGFSAVEVRRQGGDGGTTSFEADLSALYKSEGSTGATGGSSYTVSGSDDWQAVSLEIAVGASNQTTSGVTGGSVTVPFLGGVHRVSLSTDADDTTMAAIAEEGVEPMLLATLSPLAGSSVQDAAVDSKASSGFYAQTHAAHLSGWPSISRSLYADDTVGGGLVTTEVGALPFSNPRDRAPDENPADTGAGEFDVWVSDYVWDQRPLTLQVAGRDLRDDSLTGPLTVLVARTSEVSKVDLDGFEIAVEDLNAQLDTKAQSVRLAGTGSTEGGAELEGVRAPLCLGSPKNVKGLLVDRANQIYLVHRDAASNAIQSVDAVYVGGNLISADDYEVTTGESNIVQINTSLDEGFDVTFDVTGPSAAGSTVGSILEYLMDDIGPLGSANMDTSRLALFNALYPYSAGWYVSGEESLVEAINGLCGPIAWTGPNADGLIDFGLNLDPDEDFTDYELPEYAIRSVRPIRTARPAKSIATGYQKNWNQVSEDGIAAAAKATERGNWSQLPHYRIATEASYLSSVWPSARTPDDYVLPLLNRADAVVVAGWIQDVFTSPFKAYTVTADLRALRYQPGRVVSLSWPRWGMDTAAKYRIARVSLLDRWNVELIVWRLGSVDVLGTENALEFLATESGALLGV